MQNIQVLHLWQLDLTILTAQISRSSVERTGVCGCQSTFTALIASDSNSKHTRKTLTDFGLTGTSLRHLNRHLKTLWDGRKKWHAIVQSRTVTWLTRWRLPQWNQLNPGIFFLTNAMRKHATMLAGTNTPAPNWSVISYIQQQEPTVKLSGTENKVISGSTRSRSSVIGWKQIQQSTQRDVPTNTNTLKAFHGKHTNRYIHFK